MKQNKNSKNRQKQTDKRKRQKRNKNKKLKTKSKKQKKQKKNKEKLRERVWEGWKIHSNRAAGVFQQDFLAHVSFSPSSTKKTSDSNPSLCLKSKEAVLIHKASSFSHPTAPYSICGGQRCWDVSESLCRGSLKHFTCRIISLFLPALDSTSHDFFMGWNASHEISLKGEDYFTCTSV